jgi:hypothetical protein
VLIGLSVNRYGAEFGAFDLHGLIPFSSDCHIAAIASSNSVTTAA